MPAAATKTPTSCGGQIWSGVPVSSNPHQVPSPAVIASTAPCVVALDQYNPASNGTKAATNVTL